MKYRVIRSLLTGVLGVCALVQATAQDQLRFTNGDILNGTFLGQTDALIYFESEFFGTIKVPTRDAEVVSQLEQRQPSSEESTAAPIGPSSRPSAPEIVTSPIPAKPPGTPTPLLVQEVANSSGLGILWESAEKTLNRFVHDRVPAWFPRMPEDWKGQLKLGYNLTQATTTNSRYYGELALDANKTKSNYQFKSYFAYAKQGGVSSEHDWGLSGRYRYKFDHKSGFFETLASHDGDELFDPRFRSTASVGWGIEPINNERLKLDTVFGGAVDRLERRSADAENSFKLNFNENLQWKFNKHLTLKQSLRFYVSPTEDRDYYFRFESGLDALIIGAFNLGLSYRLDYDSSIKNRDARKKSRVITSLGVKF